MCAFPFHHGRMPSVDSPSALDVLTSDGRPARLRTATEADRDGLIALHAKLDEETQRLRFFSVSKTAGPHYVDHVLEHRPETLACLVATISEEIVGLATAERISDDAAEIAFLVARAERGHGLGTLLLEHLATVCHQAGIRRFVAEVLPENSSMLQVFRDAGFTLERHADPGVLTFELSTDASEAARSAREERECLAEARSLERILLPSRVAVCSVDPDDTGDSTALASAIVAAGFAGELWVVGPRVSAVAGVGTAVSLSDVPGRVDLVLLTGSGPRALALVQEAGEARAFGVAVLAADADGPGVQGSPHHLRAAARRHGMRLLGPGARLVVHHPGSHLDPSSLAHGVVAGGAAFCCASEDEAREFLDTCRHIGTGVASLVATGDAVDVTPSDLLGAWLMDPRIRSAAMSTETSHDVALLARRVHHVAEHKPVLMVVDGAPPRSDHPGVLTCESLGVMARAAHLLDQPLPAGRRLVVVTDDRACGDLAVALGHQAGLETPPLSRRSLRSLRARPVACTVVEPGFVVVAPPSPGALSSVIGALMAADEVDSVLVALHSSGLLHRHELWEETGGLVRRDLAKPLQVCEIRAHGSCDRSSQGLTDVEEAVRALALVVRYAEGRTGEPSCQ